MVAPAAKVMGSHTAATAVRGAIGTHAHLGGEPEKDAPKPRHSVSGVEQKAESVASTFGEGLFGAAFMASIAGFLGRKTIGQFSGNLRGKFGLLTRAPAHALDATSFAEFFKNPKTLVANYWDAAAKYAEEFGKGGAHYAAKAEALGGAKAAEKIQWGGFGKFTKSLPRAGMFSALMTGGLALGSALALWRAGKETSDGLSDLKEVAEDLTGRKITIDQLVNRPESLPPIVQEMRANLKAHLIPTAVGAAGTVVEKTAFATLGGPLAGHAAGGLMNLPMAGMMGGMMLEQAAEGFKPSEKFVDAYLDIRDLQREGKPVAPDYYARLIVSASPEARRAYHADSRQVVKLAEDYAGEQLSASKLVHEIERGEPFMKRADAAAKAVLEEDKASHLQPAHDDPIPTPESKLKAHSVPTSHVAMQQAAHEGKMQQADRKAEMGAG